MTNPEEEGCPEYEGMSETGDSSGGETKHLQEAADEGETEAN